MSSAMDEWLRHSPDKDLSMGWIGVGKGIFRLHDSNEWCGSFISIDDAADILDVRKAALSGLPSKSIDGAKYVDEATVHCALVKQAIPGAPALRVGRAQRSFDELVLKRLVEI